MVNWGSLIQKKYDLLQQQADTSRMGAEAAAAFDRARAGVIPAESAANIARTQQETALVGEQAKYFGETAKAGIGLMGAQAGESKARVGLIGAQTTALGQLNSLKGSTSLYTKGELEDAGKRVTNFGIRTNPFMQAMGFGM